MNSKKAKLLRKLIKPLSDFEEGRIPKRKIYSITKKHLVTNQTSKFTRWSLNAWFIDTFILK